MHISSPGARITKQDELFLGHSTYRGLTLLTYPDNCLIVGGSARFNKVGFWTIDQSQWRSALVSEQRERRTSLCEEQKKQILHKYEKETHNN